MKLENMTKKQLLEYIEDLRNECEALWNIADYWSMCEDDYSMHDQYEALDEKYDINEFDGRIILKELYTYTEEDGYQLKETGDDE
jgi:hypothetical protein